MAGQNNSVKQKILLVEDDLAAQEISREILVNAGYDVSVSARGDEAEKMILDKEWDLILLDVMLPGKDGFSLLETAKKTWRFTPVVLLTVLKEREDRIRAYNLGVDDFVNKPFDKWEFLARIRSLLNLRKIYRELEETQNVIVSLAQAVEAKDPYTRGHSERVGEYCKKIALSMGFSGEEAENLYWAGILHDIGKIAVPLSILTKPDKLTEEEFRKIQVHPDYSFKICESLRTLKKVLPAILYHHERWDGKGYPKGLSGEEIPLEARIMAVADSYDAMTSNRAYRSALPKEKALSILREGKDLQWHGLIVDTFLRIVESEA